MRSSLFGDKITKPPPYFVFGRQSVFQNLMNTSVQLTQGETVRTPISYAVKDRIWPPGTFMGQLTAEHRELVFQNGTLQHFAHNEVLIMEGDRSTHVFVLIEGWFKVVAACEGGDEALLAVRVGGDLIGELAALDRRPRSASVRAVSPGTAWRMTERRFSELTSGCAAIGLALNRSVSSKLRWATRRRLDVAERSARVRLARVLSELALAYGQPHPLGTLIGIPITQRELSALVAAAKGTIHRTMGDLRTEGLIDTGYRQLVVRNLEALRQEGLLEPF